MGAPGPPTGLTAVGGNMAVVLQWTAPVDDGGQTITDYRIDVSNDAVAWDSLAAVNGLITTYTHAGLQPGSTRRYRVSAVNSVGTGQPSSSATGKVVGSLTLPGAPTSLTATANGLTEIHLSWTAPSDTGSSAITGYRIQVSSDAGTNWSNLVSNTSSTATTYEHSGLPAGTSRHYRVSAINANGTGPHSNVAQATTDGDTTVPGAPTSLTPTANGSTEIHLSWTAPSDTGSSAVTGYRIEVSSDAGTNWSDLVSNTTSTATTYEHSGLPAGSTRHYRVSAINAQGTGSPSSIAQATTDEATTSTVPGAPTNLTAAADGSTTIRLSWAAPTDIGSSAITGYRIEVSNDGGVNWGDLTANTNSTVTTYRHTGLQPGSTRHYRVSAINAAGTGSPSGMEMGGTEATVPGAPTNLVAIASGQSQLNLSWNAPGSDGGSPITGYRIEVSENGGSAWSTLVENTLLTGTTYTDSGLSAATTRHYRVSAINAAGTGPASNVAQATTSATVPDAPTELKATANGALQITLSWKAPGSDGGSPVTGYRILVWQPEDANWSTLVDNTGLPSTTYTHMNVLPASTWHYRVLAINAAGVSPESNTAIATTEPALPGPPTQLSAEAQSSSWIEVSWKAPADTGGVPIRGYQIEVYADEEGSGLWTVLVDDTRSNGTTYHHTGLAPGSRRNYRVSAINAAGVGQPSKVAKATTHAVPPDAPTGLTATAKGASRIDLEWRAPDYEGGGPVTGYRIEYFNDPSNRWDVLVEDTRSTATTYAHTGLSPASTWLYRVAAINSAGAGALSNQADATTDPVAPDAPTDLAAEANGTSRIDLAWKQPGYDGGARITGYRVEVSENAGATWTNLVENTHSSATVFPDAGLAPATTRHYRVSAINMVGAGEPSGMAFATTDATVPDAPTRLAAVAVDHQQIDLAWATPAFDGGAAITGFRIEVSENGGVSWMNMVATTGSTATTYSHHGLRPATMRHYRVSAINEIGTSPASNVASATTDAIAPDPPTNLVATATEATRIDLTWEAPEYDGGAPATSYRVEVSEDGTTWGDLQHSTGDSRTSYAHTGLQPGSTRHYRVSAINAAGTGLPSNVASATTDDPVQRAGRVNEAVLPHFASAMISSTLSAISGRIEAVASGNALAGGSDGAGLASLVSNAGLQSLGGRDVTVARLLDGASFTMPVGGGVTGQQAGVSRSLATWAGIEQHNMGKPNDEVSWEGDMVSLHVGTDLRIHRNFLAGLAGSRSSGSYDFTDATGAREVAGTYDARITSVNPYVAWLPERRGAALWVVGGLGWGEVEVDDDIVGKRWSGTRMSTGALGGSTVLLSNGLAGLRVRGEGWFAQVEVNGAEGMEPLTLHMRRARFALEWSLMQRFQGGHQVSLQLEGGLRYGFGDGTEGAAMEFGGGLRYVSPSSGVKVEGHGRMLATRSSGSDEYQEWGLRGLVQINPQGSREGLSIRLVPAWGETTSGIQELWERGVSDRPDQAFAMRNGRLNAHAEYGLPAFQGAPYGRLNLAHGGAKTFGTGLRYEVSRVLNLRLEGTRTGGAGRPTHHGLAMRGSWQF